MCRCPPFSLGRTELRASMQQQEPPLSAETLVNWNRAMAIGLSRFQIELLAAGSHLHGGHTAIFERLLGEGCRGGV